MWHYSSHQLYINYKKTMAVSVYTSASAPSADAPGVFLSTGCTNFEDYLQAIGNKSWLTVEQQFPKIKLSGLCAMLSHIFIMLPYMQEKKEDHATINAKCPEVAGIV